MNYFFAALAGFIQGLTEFLPVSSSGHLVVLHDIIGFNLPDNIAFDVVLHLGTALALLAFFWSDIIQYAKAFLLSLKTKPATFTSQQWLAWYLIIGTVPAGIVGFYFEDVIDTLLRNISVVAVALIVVGILLYFADRFFTSKRDLASLTMSKALGIGCAQALALIPGVSRSGITIIAGLATGLHREAAARFSFLLAIPIVAVAGLKEIGSLFAAGSTESMGELAIGFVVSAIVGFLCIKFFLRFLQSHSLAFFAYYRIVLGISILMYLYA
jgi:undecaprenyl-diphosphatase